ncbi:MAG: hypothetical protein ACK55Z_00055, partial [bacterium]
MPARVMAVIRDRRLHASARRRRHARDAELPGCHISTRLKTCATCARPHQTRLIIKVPIKNVGCAFTRELFPQGSRATGIHLNGSAELVLALNLDLM